MTTHTVDELLQLAHLNGAACHDIGFHGALKNKAEVRRLELEAGKIQRELRTALAQKWRPIAEASKDGTPILLRIDSCGSGPCGARVGYFYGGVDWTAADNICEFIFNPTHYMPYNPPAAPGGEPQ